MTEVLVSNSNEARGGEAGAPPSPLDDITKLAADNPTIARLIGNGIAMGQELHSWHAKLVENSTFGDASGHSVRKEALNRARDALEMGRLRDRMGRPEDPRVTFLASFATAVSAALALEEDRVRQYSVLHPSREHGGSKEV